MLIELKNVPVYDKGLKVKACDWTTLDKFENVVIKLEPARDSDSTEEYWVVIFETQNTKINYRAPTKEKQQAMYELVKAALLTKQDFLSIDFEEWK